MQRGTLEELRSVVEGAPFGHETVLKVNMCMSIESGIYIPDKLGIRLEDVVVITEEGPKVLNHAEYEFSIT